MTAPNLLVKKQLSAKPEQQQANDVQMETTASSTSTIQQNAASASSTAQHSVEDVETAVMGISVADAVVSHGSTMIDQPATSTTMTRTAILTPTEQASKLAMSGSDEGSLETASRQQMQSAGVINQ